MHGLPKIVLERLKRERISNQLSRQSTIDNRQSAMGDRQSTIDNRQFPHPDANLLVAFVEKTLSERERTQVLTHLAQCAECRALAALTLPREVEVAQPVPLTAKRWWSAWPALRWGALAAALGAAAIVVLWHPYPWRRHETVSKEMHRTAVANSSKAQQQSSVALSAQPTPRASMAKAGAAPRESPRELAELEKGAGPLEDRRFAAPPAGAVTKQRVRLMAAARPPAAAQVENIPTVTRAYETRRSEPGTSVGAMPGAPPPPQPASKPPAAPEATPKATVLAGSQAGATPVKANGESAAVSTGLNAGLAGGVSAPGRTLSGPLAAVPMRANSQQAKLQGMALRGELESAMAQLAALWSISPSGKVQRSYDGGKTWEEVRVDDRVTFRVIQAMGKDVWAGGSGGALYHSSDGGAIWTRVNLSSGGSPTTETIVAIISSTRDLQHISVETLSGVQWTTEDGGRHWQREP